MTLSEFIQLLIKMIYLLAPFGFTSVMILIFTTPWLEHHSDQGGIKGALWTGFTTFLVVCAGAWLGTIGLAFTLWVVELTINLYFAWWAVYESL